MPFVDEALRIVAEAEKQKILLRILGAAAVRLHSPGQVALHNALERKLTDVDLVAYGKQDRQIDNFFGGLGYELLKAAVTPGLFVGRKIFIGKTNTHVDVFLDKLSMCHVVDFKDRLEVDYPTIPLAELVLEKLQIVKINEKDIKDMFVLFLEHGVGTLDKDTIRGDLIAKILSKDWGFYYTITTNLNKVKALLPNYPVVKEEQRKVVVDRVDKLLAYIEKEPKSLGWKMRAKVGTSKKWYNEVEEVERAEWLEGM